jgi:hypothetical protein
MRSVPRRGPTGQASHELKVDSWSNELVVTQSPAGKGVSTEAEDIIGIRYQAMTDEDIAN